MIDRAWGGRALPDRDLPWRAQVEFHAHEAWRMYQEHPWLVWSNLWRMPLGPARARRPGGPLPRGAADRARRAHGRRRSRAWSSRTCSGPRAAPSPTRSVSARTGVTADDYWESRAGFWTTYYSQERFPAMTRIWEAGAFDDEPGRRELAARPAAAARRRGAASRSSRPGVRDVVPSDLRPAMRWATSVPLAPEPQRRGCGRGGSGSLLNGSVAARSAHRLRRRGRSRKSSRHNRST